MSAILKHTTESIAQWERDQIRAHIAANEFDEGLLAEALHEHRLAQTIRETFYAGDTAELGRLADIAMREYMMPTIERERDL